jgi:hypothetical protein
MFSVIFVILELGASPTQPIGPWIEVTVPRIELTPGMTEDEVEARLGSCLLRTTDRRELTGWYRKNSKTVVVMYTGGRLRDFQIIEHKPADAPMRR